MPDLWSKLGLSHSNTISCTETSQRLGKVHIMNHVGMDCTLNNNKQKIDYCSQCHSRVKRCQHRCMSPKTVGHGLFHTTEGQIPPMKNILWISSQQQFVPQEINHSWEENNPGVITTFLFTPLFSCQILHHFFVCISYLLCLKLNIPPDNLLDEHHSKSVVYPKCSCWGWMNVIWVFYRENHITIFL